MKKIILSSAIILLLFLLGASQLLAQSFKKPAEPSRKLSLENVRKPGKIVDISTLYGKDNKPLLLMGLCPE